MPTIPGKALALIAASTALLFALAFLAEGRIGQGLDYGRDPGPNSFSTSAIGFAGLVKMCESVFGEPSGRQADLGEFANVKERLHVVTGNFSPPRPGIFKGAVLVILPKWDYAANPQNPSWVADVALLPATIPEDMANDSQSGEAFLSRGGWPEKFGLVFDGPQPEGSGVVQLITGRELVPVISAPDGFLLSRTFIDGAQVFILSDPDIANNMGLFKGQNAILMAEVMKFIQSAAKTKGPPVFLEPSGLGEGESDIFGALFKMPLLLGTILASLTVLLIALPACQRFGAPPRETQAVSYCKEKLIDNGARLLARSGRAAEAIDGYLDLNLRAAGKLSRAPERLEKAQLLDWLELSGKARGLSMGPKSLADRAARLRHLPNQAEALRLARDIHKWKTELEHGSFSHSRNRQ